MIGCSDCGADLLLGVEVPDLGEIVICPECGVELEVTRVKPLALRVLVEGGEQEDGQPS